MLHEPSLTIRGCTVPEFCATAAMCDQLDCRGVLHMLIDLLAGRHYSGENWDILHWLDLILARKSYHRPTNLCVTDIRTRVSIKLGAWLSVSYAAYLRTPPAGCASYVGQDPMLQPSSCQARLSSYSAAQLSRASVLGHNNASRPYCTQADITGELCSSIVGDFLEEVKDEKAQKYGVVGIYVPTTYATIGESNDRSTTITTAILSWDPLSSLAPGCTLGCHSCQINGGSVKLIHWLPVSSTWVDGTYSAISGSANEMVTLLTLGTTLTSPTVYISFDSLYARDSCSVYDKTYSNKIVAITNTANLNSLYGWDWDNGLGSTASFNFTDL